MQAKHRSFRGMWSSWQELFNEALVFATQVGPKNLINISHSEDGNEGIVVVWYWENNEGGQHDWS